MPSLSATQSQQTWLAISAEPALAGGITKLQDACWDHGRGMGSQVPS